MNFTSQIVRLDKANLTLALTGCGPDDQTCLIGMYDAFTPKRASQGLPPEEPGDRRRWVDGLLGHGYNFLAWLGEEVIGHAALLPDGLGRDCEFMIFVSQSFRRLGVGFLLARTALDWAGQSGAARIWLVVEKYNFAAIRLYLKLGFKFADEADTERMMVLEF